MLLVSRSDLRLSNRSNLSVFGVDLMGKTDNDTIILWLDILFSVLQNNYSENAFCRFETSLLLIMNTASPAAIATNATSIKKCALSLLEVSVLTVGLFSVIVFDVVWFVSCGSPCAM